LLRRATATPLHVQGIENLPKQGAFVVVANHCSYLDSFVLTAAVPRQLCYVAKQELQAYKPVGLPLAGLGTLFVERFDAQRSARDAGRLTQALQGGAVVAFFPEGTFDRMPGLLPFRIGAFLAATQARVPVVPVTLRGTRSMLRANSWLPRHGPLRVVIGKPISPQGEGWQAAIALRDAARAVILRHCGEPDLAGEQAAVFRDTRQ
jgi:1-acyl-sn-glycerol-3-phosphate acyltransferase